MSEYAEKMLEFLQSDTESTVIWFIPEPSFWTTYIEREAFYALLALAND